MTVLLPKVTAFSKYRPDILNRLETYLQYESKWENKELIGKALFFVCPELEWKDIGVSDLELCARQIISSAYLILGHVAKHQTLDPQILKKAIAVPPLFLEVSQPCNTVKPSLQYYFFLLLKATILYDRLMNESTLSSEEVMASLKALFPLSFLKSISLSEKDDFAMDQQCLWVTSEWLFAHQCKEGIEYCRQLANFALQTNTQHSLRLFGSIWWEITLDLLPSAIDAMQQKRAPDAQQALATAIGRLLRICPRDSKWSQMVQNWAKLGCASYAREVRGDVGSWTRSATLSCMNDLLYPFAVDLGSLKWTGFATVGTICENEPLNVFFPLSLGSCLFPDGRSWGLKEEEKKKKVGEENEVVDCFVKLALKQLMEQHTKIRQLAADLLFGLDRTTPLIQMVVGLIPPELQNSSLASMPSLMKCLIHAVKLSELRPTLLRGLIYTVGGNTPTVTEEMSKELIEVIGDDAVAKEVLAELVVILKEEASAHRNGFYPALRTLILCCESVDLGAVLGAELQLELYRLIPKLAVWQAKNKNTAVMKSLLDLYALLLPLWTPDRSILAKALPFLEYPNPAIRSEAAQVLYMHLSMNGLDPEAQAVLEGGSFGSANYKDSVAALRKLCSSFSVCSNKQAR